MTKKTETPPFAHVSETMKMFERCGLLLVSGNTKKANVMTIGWGPIGPLWSKPFFIVAVRPSRHTFKFMEETGDFTVNVPREGMEEIADYCGKVSGRDYDKFKEKNLHLLPSKHVRSPIIAECKIHYECKVAYRTKTVPGNLPKDIISSCYPQGDYHTLYFGEILATYADEDLKEQT